MGNLDLWFVLLPAVLIGLARCSSDSENRSGAGDTLASSSTSSNTLDGPKDNVTWVKVGNETYSFHPLHPGPFAVSQYSITCCRNGTPEPDPALAPHLHDWSQDVVGLVGGTSSSSCRRFTGYYSVPGWVLTEQSRLVVGVRCRCPPAAPLGDNQQNHQDQLDRNCRYLPTCANGGYRSFSVNLRCVCPPQWFGDLCDKLCLNGVLHKFYAPGDDGLGVDKCQCDDHFFGEACDQVQCFNGGTPVKQRACLCPPPFVGPHCEESSDHYHTHGNTLAAGSSFRRDLSSTVVSLFLALALALGVYFLIRRRTRWMRERIEMIRRRETTEDQNHSGPPPAYCRPINDHQEDPHRADLPPPPAYHDVVKTPPPAYFIPPEAPLGQVNPAPVASSPHVPVPAAAREPVLVDETRTGPSNTNNDHLISSVDPEPAGTESPPKDGDAVTSV